MPEGLSLYLKETPKQVILCEYLKTPILKNIGHFLLSLLLNINFTLNFIENRTHLKTKTSFESKKENFPQNRQENNTTTPFPPPTRTQTCEYANFQKAYTELNSEVKYGNE